ncbi:MAG: outer membrane lipoprotein-sorting protein [Flavobacteriales bacterium]|jgi:hypothetical protein
MKNFAFIVITVFTSLMGFGQSVETIVSKYYETIGGARWNDISSMKMTANVDQGGMKIPLEIVSMNDGRMYTEVTFMGNKIIVAAFDGQKSWSTNFMSMEAEEKPADDSENARRASKEFPNPLVKYKELGYSATLMGEEKIDGTSCFKIQLTKGTVLVDGKENPNIEYYYIDQENFVPLLMESEILDGELKGKTSQIKFSDYQEVNGVIVPFSSSQGIKGEESQSIQFETIEMNGEVDQAKFNFPKK